MNIKEYIKQYNKSFEEIKIEHLECFNILFEEDKIWLGNVENKLHLFKNTDTEENVLKVINKLKSSLDFNEQDNLILSEFISKINIIVKVADRINNFKENTLLENGLRIFELFNSIKAASNLRDINISLNSNLNSFLPHLFSIIKHFQSPNKYPIFYKYWKNVTREVLCKKEDYDSFCLFYREFPEENRHLNFGSYLGTIGYQIAENAIKYYPTMTKESSDYKFLIDKVVNIPRFKDILDKSLTQGNTKTIVRYTKFSQIIDDFSAFLKSKESKLSDFSFQPPHKNWIWINDHQKKIGTDGFCHYEIITRKNKHPNKLWVEIHFQGIYRNLFKKEFQDVESFNCFWNDDHAHSELSLAYNEGLNFDDVDLLSKMEKALFHLESNFGDVIRREFLNYEKQSGRQMNEKEPLNQILYGPPGTGKTYSTKELAVKIANPNFVFDISWDDEKKRKEIVKEYDILFESGQIVFTTFHQSMSYEDFIEGIKPKTVSNQVQYEIEDGVFKSLVKKALVEYIRKDSESKETNDFDILYDDFIKSIKPLEGLRQGTFETKTGIEIMLVEANTNSILVKYLWSDNSKKEAEGQHVFSVTKEKLKKVLLEGIDPSKIKSLKEDLHPLIGHIHCELFAVYKKFYDFVIANKGEIETVHFDEDELSFEEVKEQFDLLSKEDVNSKIVKSFVIIIDEINRGNVSQIFGELITLIEGDKRLGEDEVLEVILPYSKEKFGVPPNLYIVGTMNTADRSVEALDTALRRRFSFIEMMPEYKELEGITFNGFNLKDVLKTINDRIEILLDRDHTIGHSFFINIESNDIEALENTFINKIIPLLQEYFYHDYEKIALILGEGFIECVEPKNDTKMFAKWATNNITVPELVPQFILKNSIANFEDAINSLLNK